MSTRSFRLTVLVGAVAAVSAVVACSDDEQTPVDAAAADSGTEAAVSPCGPLNLICKEGQAGKACNQVPSTAKCNGTTWECPAGSISASQCGCAADVNRPVGADCGKDAGVDAAEDASEDATSSDGGDSG